MAWSVWVVCLFYSTITVPRTVPNSLFNVERPLPFTGLSFEITIAAYTTVLIISSDAVRVNRLVPSFDCPYYLCNQRWWPTSNWSYQIMKWFIFCTLVILRRMTHPTYNNKSFFDGLEIDGLPNIFCNETTQFRKQCWVMITFNGVADNKLTLLHCFRRILSPQTEVIQFIKNDCC